MQRKHTVKTKKELIAGIAELEDRIRELERSSGPAGDAESGFLASIARDISEDSRDIFFRFQLTPRFECSYLSRSVVRVTGYERELFYDNPVLIKRIVYRDDRTVLDTIIENPQFYLDRRPEIRWRHKHDGLRWTEIRYQLYEEDDGVTFIQGIVRDTTSSVQSREQLKNSRQRLIQVINASSIPTFIIDQNHRVLYWNKACETLTGLTSREMIGTKDQWRPFYEESRPLLADLVVDRASDEDFRTYYGDGFRPSHLIKGAYEVSCFFTNLGNTGKWLFFSAAPLVDEDNELIGAIETFQDISEQKYAESALKGQLLFHKALIDTMPNPFFYKDTSGVFIGCNKAFEEFTGKTKEELIGNTAEVITSPERFSRIMKKDRELIENPGIQIFEIDIPHADGTKHDVMMNKATFLKADGSVAGIVGVINDLTDHQRLESQLRQAQKMEAIGTLASGIAHDFNNILATILMNAELVLLETPDDFTCKEEINQVIKSTERAKDLVNQILTFSRQTQEKLQPVEIVPLIKETLKMLTASLPSTIEIKSSIDGAAGAVIGSPVQIQQIVLNLCNNAAYAMKRYGGTLTVSLLDASVQQDDDLCARGIIPGEYTCISVGDTGEGIDVENKSRIFEPFFTTKPTGEGSGLGLSVVHGIVEQHGGGITYSSKPGHGTVFNIYLPRTRGNLTDEITESETYPHGSATILVVDDEEALVKVVAKVLTELEYHVIKMTSSIEALVYIRNNHEKIDLVFTDLTMPRITGIELARRVREIRADLPVILCTGYNEIDDYSEVSDSGIVNILRKPFSFADIARTVNNVLNV